MRYVKNKAGMHCARLALNLHVIHCVENGIDLLSPVTLETMQRAITLTEWFLNEAHRIYAMFAGGSTDNEAETILKKIRQLGGQARKDGLRDIMRYRPKGGVVALDRKLREMVEDGILTVRKEKASNNRAVEWYSLVFPR